MQNSKFCYTSVIKFGIKKIWKQISKYWDYGGGYETFVSHNFSSNKLLTFSYVWYAGRHQIPNGWLIKTDTFSWEMKQENASAIKDARPRPSSKRIRVGLTTRI